MHLQTAFPSKRKSLYLLLLQRFAKIEKIKWSHLPKVPGEVDLKEFALVSSETGELGKGWLRRTHQELGWGEGGALGFLSLDEKPPLGARDSKPLPPHRLLSAAHQGLSSSSPPVWPCGPCGLSASLRPGLLSPDTADAHGRRSALRRGAVLWVFRIPISTHKMPEVGVNMGDTC